MTDAKPQAPPTRADETRELLIRTAMRLFAAKGVNGVSLRAVGEAARQKNTAAVHYHFGDRDRLLIEVVDRILKALTEMVEPTVAQELKIDAQFMERSAAHQALAEVFLPLLTLPLRHPDWGRDAVKLLSRIITGDAPQIAETFDEKINAQTEAVVKDLSKRLGIADLGWLGRRYDFAFVSLVAGLACLEFLRSFMAERQIDDVYRGEAAELLDFVAKGFMGPADGRPVRRSGQPPRKRRGSGG